MNKRLRIISIIALLLAPAALSAGGRELPVVGEALPCPPEAAVSSEVAEQAAPSVSAVKAEVPEQLEEYEPDIQQVVFVPKGQWLTGVSISYDQSTQNRYQFLVLEGISGDTYSFKVSPMLGYAVRDDMVLGLKFAYQRALTKLENADIVLDTENNFNIDHLYRLGHNYYATAFMRNYFSLGRSKRFGFFNEVQLMLGGGQSKMTTGVGDTLSGTYETNFNLNVGLAPGLVMFLSDYSAIEVNVGVLGFTYTHTKSLTDQIYEAHRRSKLANFKINLFSITFGAAFYI